MSSLTVLISQHISQDQINQIARRIGATPEQTESAGYNELGMKKLFSRKICG